MKIDPLNEQYHNQPLWVVYGPDSFPSLLCCKITKPVNNHSLDAVIWGYSVYRRQPGFRTLGLDLNKWLERETNPRFFLTQSDALQLLAQLTHPRAA